MSQLVPVLDLIHELRDAGMAVDFWTLLSDPQAQWDKLPLERRAGILADTGAAGWDPAMVRVTAVRKRGRARTVENVFLRFTRADSSGVDPLGSLLYTDFKVPEKEDVTASVAEASIQEAGWTRGRGHVLDVLDRVWGKGRYDELVDGHLCEFTASQGYTEQERYWVDEPFSMIVILRDPEGTLLYHVEEPRLSELERVLVATINDRIRDTLILDANAEYRADDLVREVFDLLRMYRPHADRRSAYKLGYYFLRNYLAMGPIEPILRDPHIEDISCNGPTLPTYVAHARLQSLRTNLVFDELELNSFTIKLAQRGGKLLSIAEPLVDATLPDGSRLQAALGREVTSRGSAFTIRKFREDPLTAVDLIQQKTHSLDTMAFLWLAVELRRSMIIMGATASGKTTTLNAIGQFIPPTMKIVSIEDTREITLQHENWLAAVTRDAYSTGGTERISMFDLLKSALRQRPDFLMVGEIRGVEGLTLFQAMSTGHTCFSTMHAGSVENAVYRLENPPINVPRVMLTSLDFFITQGQVDAGGRPARRMLSMTEINGLDPQSRNLKINELYRWDAANDKQVSVGQSAVFDKARAQGGWSRSRLEEELAARQRVLARLVDRGDRHYSQVARAVRRFYSERSGERGWIPGPVAAATAAPAPAPAPGIVEFPTPGTFAPRASKENAPRSPQGK
jgi:flagellar protein FlaI